MNNRTKTISLLMVLCMMITLLPAVALATTGTATSVKIGGVELDSSYPFYVNGTNGAVNNEGRKGPEWAGEWNAKFENGTLKLNNLNIVSAGKAINWDSQQHLVIELAADTVNIATSTGMSAVVGDDGLSYSGADLTIEGSGTLIATGKNNGIWVFRDITITESAKVIATGVTMSGITDNTQYSHGSVTIEENAVVFADGGVPGSSADKFVMTGGSLIARGGIQAFENAPVLSEYNGGNVSVSSTIDGTPNPWDNSVSLNSTDYKCVAIYGAGATVPARPNTGYVFFDADNSSATGTTTHQTYTIGSSFNLNPNGFAVSNKEFAGWNSVSPVDTTTTPYEDKASISALKIPNTILYAQWSDNNTGGSTPTPTPTPTPSTSPDTTDPGNTNPTPTPDVPTVDASSGIDLWYNGGNSFGSSNSAVPTSVEIDNLPVSFTGNGREFTVGCISPNAKWVTVNWNSTSVTTNFTPDANATCAEITLPKTGDVSVMAFALMAVVAAAGAMGKK